MTSPVVTITMDSRDVMRAELYPQITPNTINNFVSLINKDFYDEKILHHVISGFMIQGGCPNGNNMGDPDYSIKGRFSQGGFKNDLKHTAGVFSVTRFTIPDSTGSQFFIIRVTSPHLDDAYAGFEGVTEGMDTVSKIADVQTDYSNRSMKEQKIKSMTVETFEETYPEPETA